MSRVGPQRHRGKKNVHDLVSREVLLDMSFEFDVPLIQSGTEETRVFQMASTRQMWG